MKSAQRSRLAEIASEVTGKGYRARAQQRTARRKSPWNLLDLLAIVWVVFILVGGCAGQLDALLRASADPTLAGERSEAQTTRLLVALASVGDQTFAAALSHQSKRVKHMVGFFISGLWTRHDLHYPLTQAVVQKYI